MQSPLENVRLRLVQSIDDLWAMKAWASERRETPLGFDTETGGLSPTKDSLRLIQLGDLQAGWAVPFQMWGGGALEILRDYEGPLVAHNGSFDCRFLMVHAGWQPPWHKIHDTMTQAHLVDPLRPKGLKSLASRLVDPRATAGEQALHDGMRQQSWTWATVPVAFQPYWIYGALDPVLTCHIWQRLHAEVEAEYAEVYDFERAVSRVITSMMLRGMRVDVPYINEKLESIRQYSGGVRAWLQDKYEISSPLANMRIAEVLQKFGQEIIWFTDHGAVQVDKEALRYYRDNPAAPEVRELCETILTVRHAEKMVGTYLKNLLELRDADDLIHASIWALGARTGRMSITEPALQTLPRDDLVVRGAFVPRPGNVLISSDYSQIEMRLAAHFARDPGLAEAFRAADEDGKDFFSEIASELFRERIQKSDHRRQMVKNMGYARLYGAGVAKMAITAGVTTEQMRPVYERFNQRYPGLSALTDRILRDARQNDPPSIRTPLGRRLVADRDREATQMVNALIQGHAAEILKRAMLDLDAAGLGDAMLLPVHDEIVFEVRAGEAEEATRLIQKTMENRNEYAVPITCSPNIMKERWTGKG